MIKLLVDYEMQCGGSCGAKYYTKIKTKLMTFEKLEDVTPDNIISKFTPENRLIDTLTIKQIIE